MDILSVNKDVIVDNRGKEVRLRGYCIGGWMNMENFINGYPGAECDLRRIMGDIIGPSKAAFFFERLLHHFFREEDIMFIKECGFNTVRLPVNYRHFETDIEPFVYNDAGFGLLDTALGWCEKHGVYAIIDLHAVQGWQNSDWHCDNSSRHSFFWTHAHFQDRFAALWEEFARRYKGKGVVAGYNIMNEPQTGAPGGRFGIPYTSDFPLINGLYKKAVTAIRRIDPHHIIFLEGDRFSRLFKGFDPPFAENLVYSSHNYNDAGFGPGPYPGEICGKKWDREKEVEMFHKEEGTQFCMQHNVPLWVGEFGSVYNGKEEEIPDRLRAMEDQIGVFEEYGAHWTAWTYKDVGTMGLLTLDPESSYMRRIESILRAKRELTTDFWMRWIPPGKARRALDEVADIGADVLDIPETQRREFRGFLAQAALSGYMSGRMQFVYAGMFKNLSETEIDRVLSSFDIESCRKNEPLLGIMKKFCHGG
ncbi:MAG: glycoside hydrolase family 5 protein [Spirochaetales bacterium]|nr:glycoside hydrolase family 5 protein [Spirochaetales bacterium]